MRIACARSSPHAHAHHTRQIPRNDHGIGEWYNQLWVTSYLSVVVVGAFIVLGTGQLEYWFGDSGCRELGTFTEENLMGPDLSCISWGNRFLALVVLEHLGFACVNLIRSRMSEVTPRVQQRIEDDRFMSMRLVQARKLLDSSDAAFAKAMQTVFNDVVDRAEAATVTRRAAGAAGGSGAARGGGHSGAAVVLPGLPPRPLPPNHGRRTTLQAAARRSRRQRLRQWTALSRAQCIAMLVELDRVRSLRATVDRPGTLGLGGADAVAEQHRLFDELDASGTGTVTLIEVQVALSRARQNPLRRERFCRNFKAAVVARAREIDPDGAYDSE